MSDLLENEAVMLRMMDEAERCEIIPAGPDWEGRVKVFCADGSVGLVENDDTFFNLRDRGLVDCDGEGQAEAWITEEGRRAIVFHDELQQVTLDLMNNVE